MGGVADEAAPVPLARLFAVAYRYFIDELHLRLEAAGWTDVRPAYGFALLAARDRPITITALAALMSMTKQAASKLAAGMVAAGYLAETGSDDARVRPLQLTPRGERLLGAVEDIYRELEAGWAEVIGVAAVERVRTDVTAAVTGTNDGRLPALRPVW